MTQKRQVKYAFSVAAIAAVSLMLSGCDEKKDPADAAMAGMTAFVQQNMPKVSKETLEAACKEGKLDILYTNVKNLSQYIDEFHKQFPCIETTAVANGDDDNLARFFAGEKQGAPPDIIQLGSWITMQTQLAQKGVLLDYEPTEAAQFPTLSPRFAYSLDHQNQGILYNTNSIKDEDVQPIKTWKDATHLLDPVFQGKRLGMVDPHGAGGGSYVVAYVLHKEIGPENVAKILEALKVTIYAGSGPAVDALASGELDLVLGNEFNGFTAIGKGAPIRIWYPEPRSASYTAIGIAAKAKNPNAAKLFVEYEMSVPGNEQISKLFSMRPGRPGVQDDRPATKEAWYKKPEALYKYDLDDMIKSYDAVVAPYPVK
jgi:iron(III) transport system substrate-binding protein